MILVEPDILVETDKSGKSNLEFETGKKAISEKPKEEAPVKKEMTLPALLVNAFQITKGLVMYRDGRSGKTVVVVLDSLTAAATGLESPTKLKLKGAYNGEPFEAEGTLGSLAALTNAGNPWPLNVTAKAFGTNLTLDGSIKDVRAQRGIDLGFTLKGSDLAALGKASGKPLPLKGPFDVSGRLSDPAPKTYKISNLKVALGNSDLTGTVEVRMAEPRPMVTGRACRHRSWTFARCCLKAPFRERRRRQRRPPRNPPKTAQTRERLLPNDPLPLEALGQADAKVKFQAGQLLLPMIALTDVSVDMNALGRAPCNQSLQGRDVRGETERST